MQLIDIIAGIAKNPWVVGISSILALIATLWISVKIGAWLNEYRAAQIAKQVTDARKDAQATNQKAQSDSDKLKAIDGR